jgi:hypothetical protein
VVRQPESDCRTEHADFLFLLQEGLGRILIDMKRWYLYLIAALFGLVIVGYFIVRGSSPIHLSDIWNRNDRVTNAQRDVGKMPEGNAVPKEVVKLRREQQLRPLTEREDGVKIQDLPNGIYGFSMCGVETLRAKRDNPLTLEIHKYNGIVYYVGYASDEHIGKYMTRQKDFHILTSPHPRKGASTLFEIPVEFVSKCEERAGGDGELFDLFVATIPELQT